MQDALDAWQELQDDFHQLQETHKIYKQKLEELTSVQAACSSFLKKQKERLKELQKNFKRCDSQGSSETELILQINNQIRDHQNVFFDMEAYLPKRN
ncbi:transmembrane protein 120B-like, partial [Pseudonaja textilis]|uniref:transmembrane protein 120B-like n=1 Tax=Pseudonaja textilis TaxID=8673 RepID=UPI000EAA66FC